jgi:hypothetical protein
VINHLGNLQPLSPKGTALDERTQLSMTPGEEGAGVHGGQIELTQTLTTPHPVKGRHGLLEALYRLAIVALGKVGLAEMLVRQRVQDDISAGRGERQGALGGSNGLVTRTTVGERV